MPAELFLLLPAFVGGLGLGVLGVLAASRRSRVWARTLDDRYLALTPREFVDEVAGGLEDRVAAASRLERDRALQSAVRSLRGRVSEGRFRGTAQLVADLETLEAMLSPLGPDDVPAARPVPTPAPPPPSRRS